jgi:hypothetical protein
VLSALATVLPAVRTKLEALVLAGQARARALARFPSLS